jgi:tetratricopeptide (TPR) repeat protein
MSWDADEFSKELKKKVRVFDREAADEMCARLVEHLFQSADPYPPKQAESVLATLRKKRFFAPMEKVADALILTERATLKVRRQYAQSLIDQGNLTAALNVLEDLKAKSADDRDEQAEARSLVGRVYKQLYVNTKNLASEFKRRFLRRAVRAYHEVYESDPERQLWPGINVVALLHLAAADSVEVEDGYPSAAELAESILEKVTAKVEDSKGDLWDLATAAEACVALNRPEAALEWIRLYVHSRRGEEFEADAFELASTLRQLTEVWRLSVNNDMGARLLPVLQKALLEREGGMVEMNFEEDVLEESKQPLIKDSFERVFGPDGPVSYNWWMEGKIRALAVARLESQFKKVGTGFLVRGKDITDALGDEPLLLTNAHVLCDDPAVAAPLHSKNAIVVFERLHKTFRVDKVLWYSPPHELDATLVRLLDFPSSFKKYFPLASSLPSLDNNWPRVYIIGYPGGGDMTFSQQDNLLLDHQSPKVHYRAPTRGGSSGSPVFNAEWELLALHHYGDAAMPRLRNKPGTYAANEGIYIKAIFDAITAFFAPKATIAPPPSPPPPPTGDAPGS